MIQSPLLVHTNSSDRRDEEFELCEFEHYIMAKYLCFSTESWVTAYVYEYVWRFFFFSSQCYPLYTTKSAMEHEGRSLFPSKLRLTQATTYTTVPMVMYKTSTFWLHSYKVYMCMIAISISREKNITNIISNDFGENKPTSNDHLNNEGYVYMKHSQPMTTAQGI